MLRSLTSLTVRTLTSAQACSSQSVLTEVGQGSGAQAWRALAQVLTSSKETLTIDKTAVERLKKLQADKGAPVALRIEVEGGGCSGFHYKFELDTKVNDDDVIFEQDGSRVVCDTGSFEYLKGSKVEFEQSLLKSAFVVAINPNAEATCGCGTSFSLKMK